jgi:hypothetical protein
VGAGPIVSTALQSDLGFLARWASRGGWRLRGERRTRSVRFTERGAAKRGLQPGQKRAAAMHNVIWRCQPCQDLASQ